MRRQEPVSTSVHRRLGFTTGQGGSLFARPDERGTLPCEDDSPLRKFCSISSRVDSKAVKQNHPKKTGNRASDGNSRSPHHPIHYRRSHPSPHVSQVSQQQQGGQHCPAGRENRREPPCKKYFLTPFATLSPCSCVWVKKSSLTSRQL